MIKLILINVVFFSHVYSQQLGVSEKKRFYYDVYKYDTRINVFVNNETEQILDFTEDDIMNSVYPTRVHVSTKDSISPDYPIFITATQQKGVSSWELPLIIQNGKQELMFNNMARTLCPHDAGPDIKSINPPTIHITSESPTNTSVDIKLRRVTDFYIEINKEVTLNVTPSTPKYYYFSFDQNPWNITTNKHNLKGIPMFNYTIPKNVMVMIESSEDVCASVSIQNNSCPVWDSVGHSAAPHAGYRLTLTTRGGITLTQTMFPNGFYIVFIVKENDVECTGASETDNVGTNWASGRTKTFTFHIEATVSYKEYIIGGLVLLSVCILIAAFVVLAAHVAHTQVEIEVEPVPSTSASGESDLAPILPPEAGPGPGAEAGAEPEGGPLTVGLLTRASHHDRTRRSNRYFWGVLTVAVVYALPVVQLLYTYQKMAMSSGDQDVCYYNFLCAHALWGMSDFNHVFSNLPYLLLGAVFMLQVRARQRADTAVQCAGIGIPQHYGLLYSMGLALMMEGFLSACYHLCPNKMNFQFDSSFMYVIAVLVMIKLYQNRHSDLIPSAHSTFLVISIIMTIGVFGILFPSTYFSVLFTILHLTTCFVMTMKIYYAGKFSLDRRLLPRVLSWYRGSRGGTSGGPDRWRRLMPRHTARAVLLALANIANWTFAIYCLYEHNRDLARQLLAILMGNAILYTLFYISMKLIHKEGVPAHAWVYVVLAHVAWFSALYFFIHGNTKWSQTPAQSRVHNGRCSVLGVFDSHDVWHGLSAAALFVSFNMLLVIDDSHTLATTYRSHIPTF